MICILIKRHLTPVCLFNDYLKFMILKHLQRRHTSQVIFITFIGPFQWLCILVSSLLEIPEHSWSRPSIFQSSLITFSTCFTYYFHTSGVNFLTISSKSCSHSRTVFPYVSFKIRPCQFNWVVVPIIRRQTDNSIRIHWCRFHTLAKVVGLEEQTASGFRRSSMKGIYRIFNQFFISIFRVDKAGALSFFLKW